jgi:hypothetical protein
MSVKFPQPRPETLYNQFGSYCVFPVGWRLFGQYQVWDHGDDGIYRPLLWPMSWYRASRTAQELNHARLAGTYDMADPRHGDA